MDKVCVHSVRRSAIGSIMEKSIGNRGNRHPPSFLPPSIPQPGTDKGGRGGGE